MAFCKKCGTQIEDGAAFCPACGANQNENDVQNDLVMCILAYIGILVLVPIFAAKNSQPAKFNANQGLWLFIFSFAGCVPFVGWAVDVAVLVFSIIGIVNVCQKKFYEPLPIISKLPVLIK